MVRRIDWGYVGLAAIFGMIIIGMIWQSFNVVPHMRSWETPSYGYAVVPVSAMGILLIGLMLFYALHPEEKRDEA